MCVCVCARCQVLIVDWDVHHGNGIQDMFISDPRVLYFSVHRFEEGCFYPAGTGDPRFVGTGDGIGKNVNLGWNTTEHNVAHSMADPEYLAGWQHVLLPIAREVPTALSAAWRWRRLRAQCRAL